MKDNGKSIIIKNMGDLGDNIAAFKKMGCEKVGYYTVGGTTFLQVIWDKPSCNNESN